MKSILNIRTPLPLPTRTRDKFETVACPHADQVSGVDVVVVDSGEAL